MWRKILRNDLISCIPKTNTRRLDIQISPQLKKTVLADFNKQLSIPTEKNIALN